MALGPALPHFFWAPVSEPGFSDFQIFRLRILKFLFSQNNVGKYVGHGQIFRNMSVLFVEMGGVSALENREILGIAKIDPGKLKFRLLSVPGQYYIWNDAKCISTTLG